METKLREKGSLHALHVRGDWLMVYIQEAKNQTKANYDFQAPHEVIL